MASGVAPGLITDFNAYEDSLQRFVFARLLAKPIFAGEEGDPRRIIWLATARTGACCAASSSRRRTDGRRRSGRSPAGRSKAAYKALRPVHRCRPRSVISRKTTTAIATMCKPCSRLPGRRAHARAARNMVRTNMTVIGALTRCCPWRCRRVLCHGEGRFDTRLRLIRDIGIGLAPGARAADRLVAAITSRGHFFFADTHVTANPSAGDIAAMAIRVAGQTRFGLKPKMALLSIAISAA